MDTAKCFKIGGLYSGRDYLDYGIASGDRVLDIGGGNHPFKYATHILDSSKKEFNLQRYHQKIETKAEQTLIDGTTDGLVKFKDNEFDFIYCSHILEHVEDLPTAIQEISRVGRRGFVATPHCSYDFWAVPRSSGHKWFCDYDYVNNIFLIKKRTPSDFVDIVADVWGTDVMWGDKGKRNEKWRNFFEGHNCGGIRMFWEIRFFWEDKIDYKIDNNILPQLNLFREMIDDAVKEIKANAVSATNE